MDVRIPVESLTVAHVKAHPVWEFINDDQAGDTLVRPVSQLPVMDLDGRLVGCEVTLASGTLVWSLLGNIDVNSPRSTEHFVSVSIFSAGGRFYLSRYHDLGYATNGPAQLAAFLDLKVNEVFPIHYDVSAYARGNAAALRGAIRSSPRERLSRSELIGLALRCH